MQASFFLCSSDYINHGSIFFFVSLDLLYFNRLNFSFQQISLINSTIQMFFFPFSQSLLQYKTEQFFKHVNFNCQKTPCSETSKSK